MGLVVKTLILGRVLNPSNEEYVPGVVLQVQRWQ